MHTTKILLIIIVLCQSTSLSSNAFAGSCKRVIVVGIDFSGSYSMLNKGLNITQSIISTLEPKNCLYVRKITGESFADSCSLLPRPLCIPPLPVKPESRYNRHAWIEYLRASKRMVAQKRQAISAMSKIVHERSNRTDIYGFLAAAAVRLSLVNATDKHIVIISDMQDNKQLDLTVDLKNVSVHVVAFQAGSDPRYQERLEKAWRKVLKRCGASEVNFYPADVPFSLPTAEKQDMAWKR